jgi:hypothetical protein
MTRIGRIATICIGATTACSSANGSTASGADAGADSQLSAADGGPHPTGGEPIGCAAGPDAGGGYDPQIAASNFATASTTIDNPYLPLVVGTVQHLKDSDGNIIEITVTAATRTILGVTCVVVRDTSTTAQGTLLEDTYDFFAQDSAGNVWYFGEDTKAYGAAGMVDTSGSWIGGVDCAKPGIVMEAHPKVGDSYRQEFHAGDAEDQADVLAVDETVTVAYGTFQHCLKTRDYSRLEPGADENKYYCAGYGNVLTLDLPVSTGKREELVSVSGPGADGGTADAPTGD